MNQKNIVLTLVLVVVLGAMTYFLVSKNISAPNTSPTTTNPSQQPVVPTGNSSVTPTTPQQLFTSLGITPQAEVVAMARAILVAKVLDVQVRREVNIYTFVDFQTLKVVKGDVPPRFTYRMLGGRLENVESNNPHYPIPTFIPGEEVVLFLGPEFSSDGYPTLFQESVYHVTTQN